jgi:hypothetical protein
LGFDVDGTAFLVVDNADDPPQVSGISQGGREGGREGREGGRKPPSKERYLMLHRCEVIRGVKFRG